MIKLQDRKQEDLDLQNFIRINHVQLLSQSTPNIIGIVSWTEGAVAGIPSEAKSSKICTARKKT